MYDLAKKLVALALLPCHKIRMGFESIRKFCDKKYNGNKKVDAILKYFERVWLKNPARFCVYKETDRTNNALESYHRTLHHFMKTKPTLSKFFGNNTSY